MIMLCINKVLAQPLNKHDSTEEKEQFSDPIRKYATTHPKVSKTDENNGQREAAQHVEDRTPLDKLYSSCREGWTHRGSRCHENWKCYQAPFLMYDSPGESSLANRSLFRPFHHWQKQIKCDRSTFIKFCGFTACELVNPETPLCDFNLSRCTVGRKQASTRKGMTIREQSRTGVIPSHCQQEAGNSRLTPETTLIKLKGSFCARKPGALQFMIGVLRETRRDCDGANRNRSQARKPFPFSVCPVKSISAREDTLGYKHVLNHKVATPANSTEEKESRICVKWQSGAISDESGKIHACKQIYPLSEHGSILTLNPWSCPESGRSSLSIVFRFCCASSSHGPVRAKGQTAPCLGGLGSSYGPPRTRDHSALACCQGGLNQHGPRLADQSHQPGAIFQGLHPVSGGVLDFCCLLEHGPRLTDQLHQFGAIFQGTHPATGGTLEIFFLCLSSSTNENRNNLTVCDGNRMSSYDTDYNDPSGVRVCKLANRVVIRSKHCASPGRSEREPFEYPRGLLDSYSSLKAEEARQTWAGPKSGTPAKVSAKRQQNRKRQRRHRRNPSPARTRSSVRLFVAARPAQTASSGTARGPGLSPNHFGNGAGRVANQSTLGKVDPSQSVFKDSCCRKQM